MQSSGSHSLGCSFSNNHLWALPTPMAHGWTWRGKGGLKLVLGNLYIYIYILPNYTLNIMFIVRYMI